MSKFSLHDILFNDVFRVVKKVSIDIFDSIIYD